MVATRPLCEHARNLVHVVATYGNMHQTCAQAPSSLQGLMSETAHSVLNYCESESRLPSPG